MTLPEFDTWRKDFLSLDGRVSSGEIKANVLQVIDGRSGIYDCYRLNPAVYLVEKEIGECLTFFDGPGDENALRSLRRFFLRRYAFGLVCQIDRRLIDKCNATRLWLLKDWILPRIGLSVILGFALVSGNSTLWGFLKQASVNTYLRCGLLAPCLMLAIFLVYLHVRDRIGKTNSLLRRTGALVAACLLWGVGAFFLELGVSHILGRAFIPWRSALVDATAILFAILTQVFFAKDASLGDPL